MSDIDRDTRELLVVVAKALMELPHGETYMTKVMGERMADRGEVPKHNTNDSFIGLLTRVEYADD